MAHRLETAVVEAAVVGVESTVVVASASLAVAGVVAEAAVLETALDPSSAAAAGFGNAAVHGYTLAVVANVDAEAPGVSDSVAPDDEQVEGDRVEIELAVGCTVFDASVVVSAVVVVVVACSKGDCCSRRRHSCHSSFQASCCL